MNRFNPSNSIPLIIVICLILAIILGAGFLWPKFQELRSVQKNIEEKEEEIQYNRGYFSNLSEIKTGLEEYEVGLAKITSALPDDSSLPSLLNFLQKASSQSGLVLKGISPFTISPSEEMPPLQETIFSLQLTGSYSSFKNFLSSLEKSARMIEVENISFPSPGKGKLIVFSLRIKVHSY